MSGLSPSNCPLRSYFKSGWAFLIPYLAVYLLYYVTKWPVNPAGKSQNPELQISQAWVPCMLHVYWALHAIHAILAGIALWSWLSIHRSKHQKPAGKPPPPETTSVECRPPTFDFWAQAIRLAPWLFLALTFYIPGVYLEWPSDPWEHLRRINEWRPLDIVGAHSSWLKSAYFLPYSFLSWCIGLRQLFWLDFYYTGICLLLCWQYYRFARSCGVGVRYSMVFVLIQAILCGNNVFSFYRYYGISSSIYAQLGAIALTRIVLEWASRGTKLDPTKREVTDKALRRGDADLSGLPLAACPDQCEATEERVSTWGNKHNSQDDPDKPLAPDFWNLRSLLRLLAAGAPLLALIAFNHPQGIGIAGLGVAAILVWRLLEWNRSALWWITGGTILINALFVALYPRPPIVETLRAQGWLNAWYGFNLFAPGSPANDRLLQIFSIVGFPSVCVSLYLTARNHIVGWLTIFPTLALTLPAISIPFAVYVADQIDPATIGTFQRMLFGSIYLLCPIVASEKWRTCIRRIEVIMPITSSCSALRRTSKSRFAYATVTALLCYLVCAPPSAPYFNRTWHTVHSTAGDFKMRSLVAAVSELSASPGALSEPAFATLQIGAVLKAVGCESVPYFWRNLQDPVAPHGEYMLHKIRKESQPHSYVFALKPTALFTWSSPSGQLSMHWNPKFTAISGFGSEQISDSAATEGATPLQYLPAVVLHRN